MPTAGPILDGILGFERELLSHSDSFAHIEPSNAAVASRLLLNIILGVTSLRTDNNGLAVRLRTGMGI